MGTGSDVGKSQIVAGLCRYYANLGYKVAPFKPQNMANNAMVADDGGEVGRAQALQARAARGALSHHFNPILLKPESGIGSQLIIHGKSHGHIKAKDYYQLKPKLLAKINESYQILQEKYDIIIVEGAGSPAEINLRAGDVANMGFASEHKIPVVLIGDIHRGGVIASLIGTKNLLSHDDNQLIKAYIINKFQGDIGLFDDAHHEIIARTNWANGGIIPFFADLAKLPQEDSMNIPKSTQNSAAKCRISVLITPKIANFDDCQPLIHHPNCQVNIVKNGDAIAPCDWIILCGSKSTISDCQYIFNNGWHHDIISHYRRGGKIFGICGGMQILGAEIHDEMQQDGIEQSINGLGLLPIITKMRHEKTLKKTTNTEKYFGTEISYYEIHCGQSISTDATLREFIANNGFISADKRIIGTYSHGIFNNAEFLNKFCESRHEINEDYDILCDRILDNWANFLSKNLDISCINSIIKLA